MKTNIVYALTKIRGIGSSTTIKIIDYMQERSITELQQVDYKDLCSISLGKRFLNPLKAFFHQDTLTDAIRDAEENISTYVAQGVNVISILDDLYPAQLRIIKDPPVLIYCKGNIELLRLHRNIAVVGTRMNTSHGAIIAERTVQYFVSKDYTIVSGLALGIDSVAHKTTLASKGKTIAVLVDVDNIAPTSNKSLANQIVAERGLLLSENEPGTKIHPAYFAQRDRIQSGLSLAAIPIETTINGGTMHAVNAAIANNRLVFVPDPVLSGYESNDIPQLSGIIHLSKEKTVISYTKADYVRLLDELDRKQSELISMTEQTSHTQKQGTLF